MVFSPSDFAIWIIRKASEHAAALHQLDVHAVVGVRQPGDVRRVQAGLVGDDRNVHPAAHPARLLEHRGRHRLLDELHALRFQPVDLADRLFLVLPALVGVHPQRFLRHAAHGSRWSPRRLARPTLILRIGNCSASRTFCRVISGVSMPMEKVVTGASSRSRPK